MKVVILKKVYNKFYRTETQGHNPPVQSIKEQSDSCPRSRGPNQWDFTKFAKRNVIYEVITKGQAPISPVSVLQLTTFPESKW